MKFIFFSLQTELLIWFFFFGVLAMAFNSPFRAVLQAFIQRFVCGLAREKKWTKWIGVEKNVWSRVDL